MTQAMKNRLAISIYFSVIIVIMVLTGGIGLAPALVGPTAYMMINPGNKRKLYPTLPDPEGDRLRLEQKKEEEFEDWLYSDLPDESVVWEDMDLEKWGTHRGHIELVKDKSYYAPKRIAFVKNEITKSELEEAFNLAREHVDVTMWQYEVEKARIAEERAKRERIELKERSRREAEEALERKERQRVAEEQQRKYEKILKKRYEHLLKAGMEKIPDRSPSTKKALELLNDKLDSDKAELARLRLQKRQLVIHDTDRSAVVNEKLIQFYAHKINEQKNLVARTKRALTQAEAQATMQEKPTDESYKIQPREFVKDQICEEELDAEVVFY